jgi:ABC-type nitrate/sulfonate/bicarbonate transport system substrate-binding protein
MQAADGKTVVRMALPSKGGGFWPVYVARDAGFFAGENLDVQLNELDPNLTVASLIGHGVDIAYADSTQLLFALEKNADLVAVGLNLDRQPYRLMAAAPIKTVAGLRGKKIGAASEIDVYTYVIRTILRNAGLNPDKDVQWVIGGNQTRRLAALTAGSIDAGLFSPPSDSRLGAQGYNALAFAPDIFQNLTLSAQTVNRDWARGNGAVLRRILTAEAKAVAWLNDPANGERAKQIFMSATGANAADASEAYSYYVGRHVWTDACIHEAGLVNVVKIMRQTGQLKRLTEADVRKFADPQWCAR